MSFSRKVCSQDRLVALRQEARQQGKTVVHCHGCFDIVHPGHIHHLQYAKSLGDILVVSLSSDSNVNKGIDRPLIPDDLRAASLAALECVDAVYVNEHPTAVELLGILQPDVYVKGREYEQNRDPRFLAERDIVMAHGGRVIFSSGDIVYSSTALINNLQRTDYFNDEKVRRLRQRYDLDGAALHHLIQKFRGQKVLVLGDYILDRYHFCDASGIASEGPMMTLRSLQDKDYDGGSAILALHLAGMGAKPTLIASLAEDALSTQIELRLRAAGVDVELLRHRRQIVTKHRYLVDQAKVFKVDEGGVIPLDTRAEETLARRILAAAEGASAVIFADYGYGLITDGLLSRIMAPLRQRIPVITADVSGKQSSLLRFNSVDLLCPTERELRETVQDFSSGLGAVVANLLNRTGARQAMITLGKQGLITFDWPPATGDAPPARLRSEYLPAFSSYAVDPLGCGDALLAAATLALSSGGSLQAAAFLGSLAAALEVQQLGNHPIDAEQLIAHLHHQDSLQDSARLAS